MAGLQITFMWATNSLSTILFSPLRLHNGIWMKWIMNDMPVWFLNRNFHNLCSEISIINFNFSTFLKHIWIIYYNIIHLCKEIQMKIKVLIKLSWHHQGWPLKKQMLTLTEFQLYETVNMGDQIRVFKQTCRQRYICVVSELKFRDLNTSGLFKKRTDHWIKLQWNHIDNISSLCCFLHSPYATRQYTKWHFQNIEPQAAFTNKM